MGGDGNDTHTIRQALDAVTETADDVNTTAVVEGAVDTVSSGVRSLNLAAYANVENARLTGTADLNLIGSDVNNVLAGNAGDNDITGGFGRDLMIGGIGEDRFDFNTVADTGIGAARDTINDFAAGDDIGPVDLIDLSTIDARSELGNPGNNAFSFIGTDQFTAAGQLRYTDVAAGVIVQGNTSGEGGAEFEILVRNLNELNDGNFVL